MCLKYGTQCPCFLHAGHHPEGMAENIPIFLVGIWIKAVLVLLGKKIQKSPHIFFMTETAGFIDPEKFPEVKGDIFIYKFMKQPSQIVGIDIECRQ